MTSNGGCMRAALVGCMEAVAGGVANPINSTVQTNPSILIPLMNKVKPLGFTNTTPVGGATIYTLDDAPIFGKCSTPLEHR